MVYSFVLTLGGKQVSQKTDCPGTRSSHWNPTSHQILYACAPLNAQRGDGSVLKKKKNTYMDANTNRQIYFYSYCLYLQYYLHVCGYVHLVIELNEKQLLLQA